MVSANFLEKTTATRATKNCPFSLLKTNSPPPHNPKIWPTSAVFKKALDN
jgi:hypothetical protein